MIKRRELKQLKRFKATMISYGTQEKRAKKVGALGKVILSKNVYGKMKRNFLWMFL